MKNLLNNNLFQTSEETTTKPATTTAATGECPSSHPYAYFDGGMFCCRTNNDLKGNLITLESRSCENQAKIRCPDGKCKNNAGLYLSFLSYIF